jgi:hypothetical protein
MNGYGHPRSLVIMHMDGLFRRKHLEEGKEVEIVSHGGGINDFNTFKSRIPEKKIVVVLLNTTGGRKLEAICSSI